MQTAHPVNFLQLRRAQVVLKRLGRVSVLPPAIS
jgi:hypothetical protein